jgi:hypothetical protein
MSNSIAFVEGQQNGADSSSPLRLLLRGWLRDFLTAEVHFVYRGNVTAQV